MNWMKLDFINDIFNKEDNISKNINLTDTVKTLTRSNNQTKKTEIELLCINGLLVGELTTK